MLTVNKRHFIIILLLALFCLYMGACSEKSDDSIPDIVLIEEGQYYRFVHKNDAKKARGWWGRPSDWESIPPGISVFKDLTEEEYKAMADSHANMPHWNPTDVACVKLDPDSNFVTYTAAALDSNGTWIDAGRAKHGVLNGAGENNTFENFKANVAPRLAGSAVRVFRGNRRE